MLLNELLVIQSAVCWRVYPDYPKNKSIHKVRVDAKSVADVNSFSLLSTVIITCLSTARTLICFRPVVTR